MHRLNGWACFWPPCLRRSRLPSFTCEAPCGFVLQSCLLGLQNAYLLPQPLGQIVLLLGKWVKLIGSRRCVLSAGDPGHRFYNTCGGLLASLPPTAFYGPLFARGPQCSKGGFLFYFTFLEPSVPFEHLWRQLFLCFVGLCKYIFHILYLEPHLSCWVWTYTQPSFVGGLPFPFLYKETSPCKRGFRDEECRCVPWCTRCLWGCF